MVTNAELRTTLDERNRTRPFGGAGDLVAAHLRGPPGRWLLARVVVTITATATARVDNRSRRNAEDAIALDRVRASDRMKAGRGF